MPSATRPCDLDSTPTTTWVTVRTMFTPTLTQVLRDAALARSAGVCSGSSVSSGNSVKDMVRGLGV